MVNESEKRKKFVKFAENRTQNALDAIRKIGNLSNVGSYEYSGADITKIVKALKEAIADVERRFDPKSDVKDAFKL